MKRLKEPISLELIVQRECADWDESYQDCLRFGEVKCRPEYCPYFQKVVIPCYEKRLMWLYGGNKQEMLKSKDYEKFIEVTEPIFERRKNNGKFTQFRRRTKPHSASNRVFVGRKFNRVRAVRKVSRV